jgi:hypothetical protein
MLVKKMVGSFELEQFFAVIIKENKQDNLIMTHEFEAEASIELMSKSNISKKHTHRLRG